MKKLFLIAMTFGAAFGQQQSMPRPVLKDVNGNLAMDTTVLPASLPISVLAYNTAAHPVDPTGVVDSTAGINSAIAAAQAAGKTLKFPPGVYKHSGLLLTGTLAIVGDSGASTQLVYTGRGTALQIGDGTHYVSGQISNLTILSSAGTASTGISIVKGTELFFDRVQVGGAPRSKFAVGFSLSESGLHCTGCTTSWNDTGVLLATGSIANSGVIFEHGNFWKASVAAVRIDDSGASRFSDNWIEHTPAAFLIDNSTAPSVAAAISIDHNSGTTSAAGSVFLKVHGSNPENPISVWGMKVRDNSYHASHKYCNTLEFTTGAAAGSLARIDFSGNRWLGCSTAGTYADSSAIQASASNDYVERAYNAASLPMFAGVGNFGAVGTGTPPPGCPQFPCRVASSFATYTATVTNIPLIASADAGLYAVNFYYSSKATYGGAGATCRITVNANNGDFATKSSGPLLALTGAGDSSSTAGAGAMYFHLGPRTALTYTATLGVGSPTGNCVMDVAVTRLR